MGSTSKVFHYYMCILVIPHHRSQLFWPLLSPALQDPHGFPIEPLFSKAPSTPATWPCAAASPPLPSPPPASLPSYNSPDRSAPVNASVGVIQRLRRLGALMSRWCQWDSRRLRAILRRAFLGATDRRGKPIAGRLDLSSVFIHNRRFLSFLASLAADTRNISHNTRMWEQ